MGATCNRRRRPQHCNNGTVSANINGGRSWFPTYLAFGFWNVLRILPWSRCNGTDNDESPNSLSRPNSLKPKKSSPISSAKSPPTNISLPSLNILDPSPPVSARAGRCWQVRSRRESIIMVRVNAYQKFCEVKLHSLMDTIESRP